MESLGQLVGAQLGKLPLETLHLNERQDYVAARWLYDLSATLIGLTEVVANVAFQIVLVEGLGVVRVGLKQIGPIAE